MPRPQCNMTQEIMDKVLDELESIKYKGRMCLHLFNEPLEDVGHLLGMIDKIRRKLPRAKIYFSTNGDFLSSKLYEELALHGLDELTISLHPTDALQWNIDDVKRRFDSILNRIGIKTTYKNHIKSMEINETYFQTFLRHNGMIVKLFCLDYLKIGSDRAASVSTVSTENYIRKNVCLQPLTTFNISYDGTVYPCCNFYHGLMEHRKYIVGNVNENSIFDLYTDELMLMFIKQSLKFGKKKMPCTSCRS
jgi:radical SAM protein with 4Fe4S-binding SPASM domain